jgi:16S rRNA (cytosine967-C5)-methyltransferase
MRLGGRLAAAIEILEDMQTRHRPAAEALKDWGLSHRFAGAGDRAAIGNIVYDALRRRRSAAWLLGSEASRALGYGALILEAGESADGLNAAIDGDRFAPPPLDEAERASIAARIDFADAPDAVKADVPDWCVPAMQAAFGDDWPVEGRALAARPPLDLRVNPLRASSERVLADIAGTGAQPCAIAPHGLRIAPIEGSGRHPNVQAEPAYQKGWFEIQDEGSQIAAALAGAEPGMQVLDYCAGAGGKTLALAADMENKGQIFAYDSEKARLAPIFDRLRRAETRNVQATARASDLEALEDGMDLVLVDAPCTGSGTWRRRPDAKWRLTERQLEARIAEQSGILARAARYVKPGGRLVYVTCSVFPAENADQISRFLAEWPSFRPVDHADLLESRFPGRSAVARIYADRGILLSPARSGTDGFYFASLTRTN